MTTEATVAILVAVLVTVFFGLAALVVDLGFAQDQVRKAQNAADAAALAGATCMATLTSSATTSRRRRRRPGLHHRERLGRQRPSTITVDIDGPHGDRHPPAAAVAHVLRRRASVQGTPSVTRSATATWNGAGSGCSLCVLNNANLSANADLNMDQGDLLVNGILDLDRTPRW